MLIFINTSYRRYKIWLFVVITSLQRVIVAYHGYGYVYKWFLKSETSGGCN